jgi:hypothetical protein
MDKTFIDDLSRRLAEVLPSGMTALKRDIEKNFRAILRANFERMDLVTREEFEVQSDVLARTRAKLSGLEKRIVELEKEILESRKEDG